MQDKGVKKLTFANGGYEQFPLGRRLSVFVEVTEKASGIKASASDNTAVFTDNPIKLDCDLMPPYYKPNLPLQMQVGHYVNKSSFIKCIYSETRLN